MRIHTGIALAGLLLLAACARPPQESSTYPQAYQPVEAPALATSAVSKANLLAQGRPVRTFPASLSGLAGRTLRVASQGDLQLAPGEVILTFDDGPAPGRTDRVLDILDRFDVKATFLMVGQRAEANPGLAMMVAMHGHTIGTHTFDHADLAKAGPEAAEADIAKGRYAVARALAPLGRDPDPFFRFPYLSQTGFLRTALNSQQEIILDVDVDSKDYYSDTPQQVLERTLTRLDARGGGIILFHDIHARTVAMLPDFLTELKARGYKVVRLAAKGDSVFDQPLVTASIAN